MKKNVKISVVHTRAGDIEKILGYIEEAGRAGADLVCTNEDFPDTGNHVRDYKDPELFVTKVRKVQPVIRDRLSSLASKYSMLIASNNYEEIDGLIYNTSTIYGRAGEVLGKYKKVHLADSENWRAAAGEEFNVIETDIGRIGFATCYDIYFPETCRLLSLNGADIIIHQTQGWGTGSKLSAPVGEAYMRVRAAENSVYFVVAKNIQGDGEDGGRSVILDNYGEIIAESSILEEGLLTAEFEPDYDMMDLYSFNNYFSGVPSCKARQMMARKPKLYGAFTQESTPFSEKYKDYRLHYSSEEGRERMADWNTKSDEEKLKFHW